MDIQQLNELDESILSELEALDEETVDEIVARQVRNVCAEMTKKLKKAYGADALEFEIIAPYGLPRADGNNDLFSFVGMERLKFQRFTSTYAGKVVLHFIYEDHDVGVLILPEWLPNVFGIRGRQLQTWIQGEPDLKTLQREIAEQARHQKAQSQYQSEKDYGSW